MLKQPPGALIYFEVLRGFIGGTSMVMDSIVIAEEFKNVGQIVLVYFEFIKSIPFLGTLKAEADTAQDAPDPSREPR